MTICQFFLQGRCRFGDRCWNEHPGARGAGGARQPPPQQQPPSGDGLGALSQGHLLRTHTSTPGPCPGMRRLTPSSLTSRFWSSHVDRRLDLGAPVKHCVFKLEISSSKPPFWWMAVVGRIHVGSFRPLSLLFPLPCPWSQALKIWALVSSFRHWVKNLTSFVERVFRG
jgi:hypothetical protein